MDLEQARQLAKDETTASEILIELVKNKDDRVRKAVAANPNTPIETLLSICFEFPSEVIDNPIICLLLLENPDYLTCKLPFDFDYIKRLTDIEIKRLSWTKDIGRNYLIKKYGKRSRLYLTDEQLLEFLVHLQSLSVNHASSSVEKTSQQSSTESWEQIPF